MYLTTENAAEYVGKTLDVKRRFSSGHWPKTVGQFPDGTYYAMSLRTRVCTPIPKPADLSNAIPFDIVDGVEMSAWDGTNFYRFQNPPGVDKEPPEWMKDYQKEQFQRYKLYAVEAESLRDFCERYHLPAKVWDKEADYQSHKEELLKNGYTLVPRGTSGLVSWAAYYGPL